VTRGGKAAPVSARGRVWILGGPAYRLQCDVRHAACLAELAVAVHASGDIPEFWHEHTSVLPQGRAAFLAHAVNTREADYAVGLDADTFLRHGARLMDLARTFDLATEQPWAQLGILVAQRDGKVNAWADEGVRLDEIAFGEFREAWAVGAACCVYNLRWYRDVCTRGIASGTLDDAVRGTLAQSYAMLPTGLGLAYVGEDVWHSQWVRGRGGKVYATRLTGVSHAGGF
jgi:hypothetical protein